MFCLFQGVRYSGNKAKVRKKIWKEKVKEKLGKNQIASN